MTRAKVGPGEGGGQVAGGPGLENVARLQIIILVGRLCGDVSMTSL